MPGHEPKVGYTYAWDGRFGTYQQKVQSIDEPTETALLVGHPGPMEVPLDTLRAENGYRLLTSPKIFEYNADLRLVLENWGVAIPSPEAEAAFDRVIEHNRRYGCYAT